MQAGRWMVGLGLVAVLIASPAPADEFKVDAETREAARAAIDKGIEFLKSSQSPEGGWVAFRGADPAISALAAKCFAQHPDYGPQHEITRRAYEFIIRHRQSDGGIYLPEGGLNNYYTSVAVMALLHSPDPAHKEVVKAAQAYLAKLQWDEGEDYGPDHVFYGGAGYGDGKRPDLSNTQMMLEALHESGLSPEHPVYKKALIFISRCQMSPQTNDQTFAAGGDGGFIYTPANGGESKAGTVEVGGKPVLRSYGSMTYAGFKSLLYAKVGPDDPRVKAALAWIGRHYTLDHNPNMPDGQSKEGLYYYYHVFAKSLSAWGRPTLSDSSGVSHDWRKDLVRKLTSLQRGDGSWVNEEDRWWESNPQLVTAYSILALQDVLK